MNQSHLSMSEFSYYNVSRSGYKNKVSHAFWKVDSFICLGISKDLKPESWMTANISFEEVKNEDIPPFLVNDDVHRATREVFNKYYNQHFDFLQKLRFHDGEYYVDMSDTGRWMALHAFFRQPSRHYKIEFTQDTDYAEVCISTENNIVYRRGVANRCRLLSEGIFSQVFKLVLEFFYDGSAMRGNQAKLWKTLDALVGSAVPDEPVLINDEYYYLRARELMLKRKEEIKERLLELDDIPSKRRELRAEMKGIDYCVSILDKNH